MASIIYIPLCTSFVVGWIEVRSNYEIGVIVYALGHSISAFDNVKSPGMMNEIFFFLSCQLKFDL